MNIPNPIHYLNVFCALDAPWDNSMNRFLGCTKFANFSKIWTLFQFNTGLPWQQILIIPQYLTRVVVTRHPLAYTIEKWMLGIIPAVLCWFKCCKKTCKKKKIDTCNKRTILFAFPDYHSNHAFCHSQLAIKRSCPMVILPCMCNMELKSSWILPPRHLEEWGCVSSTKSEPPYESG